MIRRCRAWSRKNATTSQDMVAMLSIGETLASVTSKKPAASQNREGGNAVHETRGRLRGRHR